MNSTTKARSHEEKIQGEESCFRSLLTCFVSSCLRGSFLCSCARPTFEKSTITGSADILIVFDNRLTARKNCLGISLDLPSFKQTVIAIHVMRFGADCSLCI